MPSGVGLGDNVDAAYTLWLHRGLKFPPSTWVPELKCMTPGWPLTELAEVVAY
jgi:hypothetical protein